MAIQPVKTSISTQRKLSLAAGLLSFSAFIIQGLSTTWGFEEVGTQIVQTMLVVSGAISFYFLGSTSQKIVEDNNEKNK